MNIAFITGCLEPGKDGVGDYTRILANECVNQGHKCILISFKDSYASSPYRQENESENACIQIIRFQEALSSTIDTEYIRNSLLAFNPDWISLQFSPYGIQKKGIVFNLSKWLDKILPFNSLFHVMFHELWIGEYLNSTLKERIIGSIQRYFLLKFIDQFRPKLIHTSNSTYVGILNHYNVNAHKLKMFGAIPLTPYKSPDWLYLKLQEVGCKISENNRNKYWLFGFFGSLYKEWPSEPLLSYLDQASLKSGRVIVLISIGKLGVRGEEKWNSLCKLYSKNIKFLRLGEQQSEVISSLFNSLDFGIAATSKLLIGKSSSVAAMLEHKLPVIINRYDYQLSKKYKLEEEDEPLYIELDEILYTDKLNHINKRDKLVSHSKTLTTQFLGDLANASNWS